MKFVPTIGIEMHCEMKSLSKVFSPAKNTYSEEANIHVSNVDIALPGVLPVLNKACFCKAIKVALILNCEIPEYFYFDRKNYYYPDLPKGYQITQNHQPIGTNGRITIPFKDDELEVLIHDVHLEEDTAQLDHIGEFSYLNYNRAGVPLLELVTEPCFHSKDEVVAFLEYMRRVYQYADISDADVTKGQIRCDVNISLSDSKNLGTRVEIKNVNSISNVAAVIDYEIKRQLDLLESNRGLEIEQESRRWDDEACMTKRMRSKEDALDYRYFVEPNIPKIKIDPSLVEKIKKDIPFLPLERLRKYQNTFGLSRIDANTLLKDKAISDYFDECVACGIDAKAAMNWITGPILGYLNKEGKSIQMMSLKKEDLKFVIDKINDGTISSKQAKDILNEVLEKEKNPKDLITNDNSQISDEGQLVSIIEKVLNDNASQVEAYHNGKTNLFQFFVGQVMKETKGMANPVKTREILEKKLQS
jgi:aspartyl-tRNA(Asn)/glutamyl-tRNA(Gln) amidotransferase subunit B